MKRLQILCVAAVMLQGLAWAGAKEDEVSQTIKACGKPLADRVDSNPSAAGGKERLLQYKGIELSYQKVDGLWVFWGSSLPIGISNMDRTQTAKNLPCFHDVAGLKGIASPGPVMPKKEYVPPAVETLERIVIDPAAESTAAKARMLRKIVIGAAAAMMALSLLGWFAMRRGHNDEES
jgi:hypothetical protein